MKPQAKMATCCYCGSRSILVPTARHGHELACASCGAPLHEMKALKMDRDDWSGESRHKKAAPPRGPQPEKRRKRKSGKKRRKSPWQRTAEEFFDVLEDIFD